MKAHLLEQAKALPLDEQMELVEAIWGNIIDKDAVPLPTTTQQEELDRRLQRHLADPDKVMTLDEVAAALTNSLR